MERLLTNDGSMTFFNPLFKEAYHSRSGALEEAFKKYIEPCKIASGMKILDVCFGIGYNSAAAIHKILSEKGTLQIVALEYDRNVLNNIQEVEVPDYLQAAYRIIQKAALQGSYDDGAISLRILVGDARQTLQGIQDTFDAIFLDPFSTMKNPELWTVDFFKLLKETLHEQGILATYSSSAIVRGGLREAGFLIGNGPIIGRARPSTLASLKRTLPPLLEQDEKLIVAFGRPFRDPFLNWSKENILEERERLPL